jgi:DNA polymerase
MYCPEWRAVLQDCGWPLPVVMIDFETFFGDDYEIKKSSTIEYVMDKRFEVLGTSVLEVSQSFPDYTQTTHWWDGETGTKMVLDHLQNTYGQSLDGCSVVAHNATFDFSILAFRYGIYPAHPIDLIGLARHWNSRDKNDLATLTKRFGLPPKGDTKKFKNWTNRQRFYKPKSRKKGPKMPVQLPVMTDDQRVELGEYANNDVMRQWELFTLMLPKLSAPKTELYAIKHTLELFTKPVLRVAYSRAGELATAMQAEMDKVIAESGTGMTLTEFRGAAFEPVLCQAIEAAGDDSRRYWKPAKNKAGVKMATAKDDPERDELVKHPDETVRKIMAAKVAVGSWPNHIKRVKRIVSQSRANDGVLPVPLRYGGAHTLRWSGGERINLQNLGGRKSHDLVQAIREVIVAPPGEVLIITDAAQIEPRVLAWIAGQWDLVAKFEAGEELYCGFAEKVLGYPCRKPRKGGIPAIEAKMAWARNSIGKVGVLGGGYGMGPAKAVDYAEGAIDLPTAERLIKTYREENHAIVKFWKDVERAFIYTFKYKLPCEMARGLRFDSTDDCDVIITLPSGHELKYLKVRMGEGRFGGESAQIYNALDRTWEHTWGGSLTENIVQAMSRHILWMGIERMESWGYHVAHHCHDEIIAVVPEEQGPAALDASIKALSERPAWAPDCSLGAEGIISKTYKKPG